MLGEPNRVSEQFSKHVMTGGRYSCCANKLEYRCEGRRTQRSDVEGRLISRLSEYVKFIPLLRGAIANRPASIGPALHALRAVRGA